MWWRTTRNYMIDKSSDLLTLLKWAEDQMDDTITNTAVKALGPTLMLNEDPSVMSRHVWAYLNLNLTGEANIAFNSVELETVWKPGAKSSGISIPAPK